MNDDFLLFAGSASKKLAQSIAEYLGRALGASETIRFSEGNLFVRVLENVRGRDVFLVQGTAFPANDNFMELLFWIDALKRASASSVTAVIPYFSYAKGDKKDEPRVSIRARVCADAIEAAGADRVVTLDLHAPQVQGFFRIPVDDLYALPVLCDAISAKGLENLVVVAPDAGFAKKARQWANRLGAPTAIADKRRDDHTESAEVVELMGSVEGRTALIVDDFTISAGTLVDAARVLMDRGATSVYAAVSHGLLAGQANARLDDSPIERLFITDSVETQPDTLSSKVEVVSVAGLFGEAIRRIQRAAKASRSSSSEPRDRPAKTGPPMSDSIGAVQTRRRPLAGCLISLALLAACSDDHASTQAPSPTVIGAAPLDGATPHAAGLSLTTEQKELAWSQARSTPWASAIFSHASQRASFVPISGGTVLEGIAVTVFFDGAVSLPAGLPMLSALGETDSGLNRKITTNTPQQSGSAVTLFVIGDTALWMTVLPQPIADHDLTTVSEPWPHAR